MTGIAWRNIPEAFSLGGVVALLLVFIYGTYIAPFYSVVRLRQDDTIWINRAFNLFYRIFYALGRITATSPSVHDLLVLSAASVDRAGSFKDFYDFKHKNISSVIKGLSGVILINFGVIVKFYWERHETKAGVVQGEELNIVFLLWATGILMVCNVLLSFLLRRCALNFIRTIRIMEELKK